MTLIVASLLGMLFDHSRRAAIDPTRDATAVYETVLVTVDPSSTAAPMLQHAIVDEAAAIWKPLGVSVQDSRHAANSTCVREVHLFITDDPPRTYASDERLGWIRFGSNGEPESLIHLSRTAAFDLMAASATLRERPDAYREIVLGRMLGRALAHELGHYLSASKRHTQGGLMRAQWSTDLLVAVDRRGMEWRP